MRMARKNEQNMYYALLIGETPEFKLDKDGNKIVDYVDEDGSEHYRETGNSILCYSKPQPFSASISFAGGESEDTPFGVSVGDYDAIIVADYNLLPIDETSLIWYNSSVVYIDDEQTIPDSKSADYSVSKVRPSLNTKRYILKAIVK